MHLLTENPGFLAAALVLDRRHVSLDRSIPLLGQFGWSHKRYVRDLVLHLALVEIRQTRLLICR